MFDQITLDLDIMIYLMRFLLGSFGTITYFIITKTGFIKTEIDDPVRNSNLYKIPAMFFFIILGGALALMFEIGNPLGCFTQGLTIKPTLTYLYSGATK